MLAIDSGPPAARLRRMTGVMVVVALVAVLGSGCSGNGPTAGTNASHSMGPGTSPSVAIPATGVINLRGTFEKWTDFPCHRSDPFVGNEVVVFHGSDGTDTRIVTGSANWIGRPADPPAAPLGECHQVAAFVVDLPRARAYIVEINDHRLAAVQLADLLGEGLHHRFTLPS
jgi:hypothetical protein